MESLANSFPDFASIARARIAPDTIRFAKNKFPGITDESIQQNLCELITAQEAEMKCSRCCVSLDMCPELLNTAGYTYVLAMQQSGRIKLEYAPCGFNGGTATETIAVVVSENYKQLELVGG